MLSRRRAIQLVSAAPLCALERLDAGSRIDRRALVRRHNPVNRGLDPLGPLSVGNGEFAFTADITGLQTFPEAYEGGIPLCTMAQWGWHTAPPGLGVSPSALQPETYETYGRSVGYATRSAGQEGPYNWLRQNPHRLHLGRIGLELRTSGGRRARAEELTAIYQRLDLWSGVLESRFEFEGTPVLVETCCHPQLDAVAVRIESPLAGSGRLAVRLEFPYGSPATAAADWKRPQAHTSRLAATGRNRAAIIRKLDGDEYAVSLAWGPDAELTQDQPHGFLLRGRNPRLEFCCLFRPETNPPPAAGVGETFQASREHWQGFWSSGGAVDFSGSRDSRAKELERRVVLSEYLTAIQCSGSMPPQETGLTCNSWYGKFHLEMHWWHAAHFALWDRIGLLERSLPWYRAILPEARRKAKEQGYAGARWPKMVGPEGRDSPSPVGPLLIWQQPHPIAYAELCYLARGHRATLERYRDVVFETAEFMASYAAYDAQHRRFVLGPPVIPAQENHPARDTWNPTFELEYWAWGLRTAQQWRKRLELAPEPRWENVRANLSALPVRDGVYLAHENCPQTFTERNRDHPSMLAALGMLPGTRVDRETMRRTLRKVMDSWNWAETWGWDYPMTAMTAARLGEPAVAVDALLMETPKNRYLPNGHNWQRRDLPLYLPGNGGLLAAVAMMAGGWQGAPAKPAPGFPADTWLVRCENLKPWL